MIRLLTQAADAPKKSGSAAPIIKSPTGAPVLRIDGRKRKEVTLTLLLSGGATRTEAEAALRELLDAHWPAGPASDGGK